MNKLIQIHNEHQSLYTNQFITALRHSGKKQSHRLKLLGNPFLRFEVAGARVGGHMGGRGTACNSCGGGGGGGGGLERECG